MNQCTYVCVILLSPKQISIASFKPVEIYIGLDKYKHDGLNKKYKMLVIKLHTLEKLADFLFLFVHFNYFVFFKLKIK